MSGEPRLEPFRPAHAAVVLSWARSPEDLFFWCARRDHPLEDPAVFAEWHRDPDIHPFVLSGEDGPVAYGEVWTDDSDRTAELARLLVAPERRGAGLGRRLSELLSREAARSGYDSVWVRVFPSNRAALACYDRAGFHRADPEEQLRLNAGERHEFVWMSRPTMEPGFRVRAAAEEDAERLAAIDAAWDTTPRWRAAQFRSESADPKAVCLVADAGIGPLGFIFAWAVGGELQVHNVAVDPAAARRGIGRALLRAALAEGARRGAKTAQLEVADTNAPAAALYSSEGFRVVGRRPKFYNGAQDALLMSRDLADNDD